MLSCVYVFYCYLLCLVVLYFVFELYEHVCISPKIHLITLSFLTLTVIYVLYSNYKKNNYIISVEYRIKTLENEFYKLDRKISEIPIEEFNQEQNVETTEEIQMFKIFEFY